MVFCVFAFAINAQDQFKDKFTLRTGDECTIPFGFECVEVGSKSSLGSQREGSQECLGRRTSSVIKADNSPHTQKTDGSEIRELLWTPDDAAVIYTRGGYLDGFGENPNPTQQPERSRNS